MTAQANAFDPHAAVDTAIAALIEQAGGYPGPSPAGWAYLAAEAVRYLNHATIAGAGYHRPADLDATVIELQALADRLPQALQQAAAWLAIARQDGHLRDTDDPAATRRTVQDAVGGLLTASCSARDLATCLSSAQRATARLATTTGRGESQ